MSACRGEPSSRCTFQWVGIGLQRTTGSAIVVVVIVGVVVIVVDVDVGVCLFVQLPLRVSKCIPM